MQHHRLSATSCGESLKNPILPIVYLLIPPARYLYPHKPKRSKARAEKCHIYIHINTNTFIYIGVLFCLYLGNFTYLFSLIISYFSYICGTLCLFCLVSYGLQGDKVSGRLTLFGGHSCQNLPEMCDFTQTEGESDDRSKREAVHQVWCNQTHQPIQKALITSAKPSGVA
jgi:hypothetical protein